MRTVDAFANDVSLQLEFLKKFVPPKKTKNSVFCGSGDSLCAAMLAEAFSNYASVSCDPLELAQNPVIAAQKHAYFVSISGSTISNIRAASLVQNTTAITRHSDSKLGMTCKNVMPLDYVDSGVFTAGTIGFLASALTCISLVHNFKIKNTQKMYNFARVQSRKIIPHKQIYILGNQHTYPIAMYCTAKLGEVLGLDSHYERIEQFSHMGLFTAKTGDTVIVLEPKNKHNSILSAKLRKLGLYVYNPTIQSKNKIDQILFYIFISQFLALNLARQKRIRDCYFVTQKKTRAASSDMIY